MNPAPQAHGGGESRLDAEIRRAVTELVDLAPLPPPLDAATAAPLRRRGRALAVAGCVVVAVALVAAALARHDPAGRSVPPAAASTIPTTAGPLLPFDPPPPRPVPADLADPAPGPNGFPLDREVSDEAAFPGNIRHRSGGPYLSEAQVRQRVRDLAHCAAAASPGTSRCDGVVVRYFDSYQQAFRDYAPPDWSYYDGTIAHDREVYLATVYGAIPYCNRAILRSAACPIYRDHQNYVVDATTGQTPIG